MKILVEPDPRLRQYSEHILNWNNDLKKIVKNLWIVLNQSNGVGLAAPQIGINQRIIVVNALPRKKAPNGHTYLMINPDILESNGSVLSIEQCLSCPGEVVKINRFKEIKVSYFDLSGQEYTNVFGGRLSAIVQHEIDHLNGKLISDYARDYKNALKEQKKREQKEKAALSAGFN